ncbi:hypothetical protein C8Q75DRAFT_119575 [Abortiporus biennis]|nr:hypothetical protein C8Q75DRAFT_119575 [Abortiporus biennis]
MLRSSSMHINEPLSHLLCPSLLVLITLLILHFSVQSAIQMPSRCMSCYKDFQSKASLKQYCSRTFGSNNALESHSNAKHPPPPSFKCRYCSKAFYSQYALESHSDAKHPPPPSFKCGDCSKAFYTSDGRDVHFSAVHAHRKRTSQKSRTTYQAIYYAPPSLPAETVGMTIEQPSEPVDAKIVIADTEHVEDHPESQVAEPGHLENENLSRDGNNEGVGLTVRREHASEKEDEAAGVIADSDPKELLIEESTQKPEPIESDAEETRSIVSRTLSNRSIEDDHEAWFVILIESSSVTIEEGAEEPSIEAVDVVLLEAPSSTLSEAISLDDASVSETSESDLCVLDSVDASSSVDSNLLSTLSEYLDMDDSSPQFDGENNTEEVAIGEQVDSISLCLKCLMCLSDAPNPLTTGCGHMFCRKCILNHLSTNDQCPVCRQDVVINLGLRL